MTRDIVHVPAGRNLATLIEPGEEGVTVLLRIADGVWEVERTIKVRGFLPLPHRMTVLRCAGGLAVHSPVALEPGMPEALAAQGIVRWIIAPSLMHDLYIADWVAAYPQARLLVCPQWSERRPALPAGEDLLRAPLPGELQVVHIAGMPRVQECVIVHLPTRTLVVADLLFNIQRSDSAVARFSFRVFGTWKRTGASRLFRAHIEDRHAFLDSMRDVLALPFDRIAVGHGDMVAAGGRATLARAWSLD